MALVESDLRPRETAEQRRKRLVAERKARLERTKATKAARRKRINETIALGEQVRSVTPYRGKSRATARPLSDKDFLELTSSDQPTGLSPKGILRGLRQDIEAHTGLLSLAGLAKPVEDNPFAGMTPSTLQPFQALGIASRTPKFIPRGRDFYGKRHMKYEGGTAQLPASPSLPTTLLQQNVFDPLSEKLATKVVDPLRGSKKRVARGAGIALTPISARARVPKNLGKNQGIAASRRAAARAVELQVLGDYGKKSGPKQVAQHWYGQIPAAHRNPEGLALPRDKLREELRWYASGKAQQELGLELRKIKDTMSGSSSLLKEGPEYYTQTGQLVDTDLYKRMGIDQYEGKTRHLNLYDESGNIRGSIVFDDRPERKSIYVESIYVAPSERGSLSAITELTRPIRADGRPIKAEFENPSLKRVFERLQKKPRTPEPEQKLEHGTPEWYDALNRSAAIQLHLSEIPKIMESQTAAIRKLDQAIKNKVPFDEPTYDAVSTLMEDHAASALRHGIPQERLTKRTQLIPEWLGVEPDGTELYFGHRMGDVRGGRAIVPGAASTGKTRPPPGFGKGTHLTLVKRGQQRTDLRTVIEDWNSTERYEMVGNAKDELGKMGPAFTGSINPKTHVLINADGQLVPRSWKEDVEEKFTREGFEAKDLNLNETDLGQYVANSIGIDEATIAKVYEAARASNTVESLRVVPRDVFDRYWNQFIDFRPANMGGQATGTAKVVKKGITGLNDIVALSIIYSNPLSYIPPNLGGNFIFAGAHQGLFLPENLTRAGQVLFGPKDVRALLLRDAGEMASTALAQSSKLKTVARAEGYITDAAPRISAVLHELAQIGVISKGKPILTKADYDKIRAFYGNKDNVPIANDIFETVQRSMVDFRLGPWERTYIRRAIFVYPWLKGATKYPFQFIKDHPIRSAILGTAVVTHRDQAEERFSDAAAEFQKPALAAGNVEVLGHKFPRVLPTGPFSPVQTAIGVGKTAIFDRDARAFGEYFVPGPLAVVDALRGRDRYGRDVGVRAAVKDQGLRLTPSQGFVQDLISPPKNVREAGLYPEDVSRTGRIKRATRVIPYAVNPEVARKTDRFMRGGKKAKTPEQKKAAELRRATRISKHYGKKVSENYTKALDAKYTYSERREQLKDQIDVEKLSESQDVALLLSVLGQHRPELLEEGQGKYEEIKGDSERMHKMYLRLRDILGFNYLSEANEKLNKAEKEIKAAA